MILGFTTFEEVHTLARCGDLRVGGASGPVAPILKASQKTMSPLIFVRCRKFLDGHGSASCEAIAIVEPLITRREGVLALLELPCKSETIPLRSRFELAAATLVLAVIEVDVGVECILGSEQHRGVIEVAPA